MKILNNYKIIDYACHDLYTHYLSICSADTFTTHTGASVAASALNVCRTKTEKEEKKVCRYNLIGSDFSHGPLLPPFFFPNPTPSSS